ncbi:hypothetical protein Zmor_027130 [Zophobas morio]|uniref:SIS domain-containing protein n=1 Tax=Zophobas morio TaxID=2755281 RepID=A0AA38M0J9_9CUCU|nr:hypothetical protein Zmor_027130 [Zophobas morio]
MMNDYVKDIKHLVITCNSEGQLAVRSQKTEGNLVFLLPPEANDKSFAMTSSYTGMMISAKLLFEINDFAKLSKDVEKLAAEMTKNMENNFEEIISLANEKHKRVIYLGSGDLNGIAEESHLKMLELTAGEVAMFYNSPMGFRHGPKSILNKESVVILYFNSDSYKRQYDLDLLKEFSGQDQVDKIVVVDYKHDAEVEKLCDQYFVFDHSMSEDLMGLNYVTFAQLFGFYKSISIGKTPDNP